MSYSFSIMSAAETETQFQDALALKIQELELEKYDDNKLVLDTMQEILEQYNLSTDHYRFIEMACRKFVETRDELASKTKTFETNQKKVDKLQDICRELQKKNKEKDTFVTEMKENLDASLKDVQAKIALYAEENDRNIQDNSKLRDALRKALEFDERRNAHVNALKDANDMLRAQHDEMDKKYTAIVDDYSAKFEEVSTENEHLKTKYRGEVAKNQQLGNSVLLLKEQLDQQAETKSIVEEFDSKYKGFIEQSKDCIEAYKKKIDVYKKQCHDLNNKLQQKNGKIDKLKTDNKALKNTNRKLDKKSSALENLCRAQQEKIRVAQEDEQSQSTAI